MLVYLLWMMGILKGVMLFFNKKMRARGIRFTVRTFRARNRERWLGMKFSHPMIPS